MRVFISFDMEGVAGIVDWSQCAAGAEDALNRLASIPLPSITLRGRLEVEMQTTDMAEVASWAKGVERDGTRSVVIEGDDPLQAFHSFVALTYITRQAEGRSTR